VCRYQIDKRFAPDRTHRLDDRRIPIDGSQRRVGLVLQPALDELGRFLADEPLSELQAAVDPG
jgi:hypothetical protein